MSKTKMAGEVPLKKWFSKLALGCFSFRVYICSWLDFWWKSQCIKIADTTMTSKNCSFLTVGPVFELSSIKISSRTQTMSGRTLVNKKHQRQDMWKLQGDFLKNICPDVGLQILFGSSNPRKVWITYSWECGWHCRLGGPTTWNLFHISPYIRPTLNKDSWTTWAPFSFGPGWTIPSRLHVHLPYDVQSSWWPCGRRLPQSC